VFPYPRLHESVLILVLVAAGAACTNDDTLGSADAAADAAVTPDAATTSDGGIPPAEAAAPGTDAAVPEAGGTDAAQPDATAPDASQADAAVSDASQSDVAAPDASQSDAAVSDAQSDQDAFNPGPATAVQVNASNTSTYNLANGQWKVFYFDAVAGQTYSISELGGIVHGYVSTSPSVSPTTHDLETDANGRLAFVAPATVRYYIAIAVSGGGASGSFQVADGGQLLGLGANAATLAAPTGDDYHFFRFPIAAGSSYSLTVTGTATSSVGLGISPRAERASNGQFSYPLMGQSGPLPIDAAIPVTSVADSYSGYYYLFLRISAAITPTITVTKNP
jgi:hypothetical protein